MTYNGDYDIELTEEELSMIDQFQYFSGALTMINALLEGDTDWITGLDDDDDDQLLANSMDDDDEEEDDDDEEESYDPNVAINNVAELVTELTLTA